VKKYTLIDADGIGCLSIVIIILLPIVLFTGTPDIHDAIIKYIMKD